MEQNNPKINYKATVKRSSTPYDDVFRTLLNDCKILLFPILNEVFGESYTGDEQIIYYKNEHFLNKQDGEENQKITDSSFIVVGEEMKSYLFECQSTADSSMLIRIFEYATQIALDEGELIKNKLKVKVPKPLVLFLRSTKNTPDKMEIEVEGSEGVLLINVFVMKVKEYGLDEIFEKGLLFLIPFYIFNYGSQQQLEELEENTQKLDALKEEYELIVKHLNELTEQGKLSAYYRMTILEMSNKVVESLAARYENVMKGVKDIMGGTVLDYKAKDILREGEMEKAKKMALSLHEDGVALELIAKAANVSVELVRKWIGLQSA